jgi:hypothetical protein
MNERVVGFLLDDFWEFLWGNPSINEIFLINRYDFEDNFGGMIFA